ncbi:MAG: MlaD family protein [Candidatus Cloacimonadaceae bacterium]
MTDFYKDQRKVELRVGIIAVVSLLVLIVGYAWLRNTLQLRTMTSLKIRFENAQGIEVGDKITVNGMETGRITKVTQLEDGVLISGQIKLKHPIRQGARYIIQDSNLMGGKQLDVINASQGDPININQVQQGETSYGMTALMSTAAITMLQINDLLIDLKAPEGFFAQVKSTFEETQETFEKVNTAIDDSKDNLNKALADISTSTGHLNELITTNKADIDKAIKLTPEVLQKTQAALDSLRIAGSTLQKVLKDMSEGKGTFSQLIKDDELYQNLIRSSAKLDSLLVDIKKNPKRYFRVTVF